MARKEIIGEYALESDIEAAVFDFCKALRRNGYDVGFTDSCNGVVSSVRLFKWLDDEATEDISLEYGVDGKWHRVAWSDAI